MASLTVGNKENERVTENLIKKPSAAASKSQGVTVTLDKNAAKETKLLDFGELIVGSKEVKVIEVRLVNPTNAKIRLSLESFPGYNKATYQPSASSSFSSKQPMKLTRSKLSSGFALNTNSMVIEPLGETVFELRWTPISAGTIRESFQVKNIAQRYSFSLVAKATKPEVINQQQEDVASDNITIINQSSSSSIMNSSALNDTTEILDNLSFSNDISMLSRSSSTNSDELSFSEALNESALQYEEDDDDLCDLSTLCLKDLAPPSSQSSSRQSITNVQVGQNARKSIAPPRDTAKAMKISSSSRMAIAKTYKLSPSKEKGSFSVFRGRPSVTTGSSSLSLSSSSSNSSNSGNSSSTSGMPRTSISSRRQSVVKENPLQRKSREKMMEDMKDQNVKVTSSSSSSSSSNAAGRGTVSANTINKKEDGLIQWLNFLINPINSSNGSATSKVVQKSVENILIEEKVVVKKLNFLCCSKQLSMRLDRDLYTDVGVRQNIINLIIHSYQPKWLIAALEGIYKCSLNISESHTSVETDLILSNFIAKKVLHNQAILDSAETHNNGEAANSDAINEELNAFRLRQVLLVIWLIDRMCERRIFGPKDRCFLNKNSTIKSSIDILHTFVGDYVLMEFQNFVKFLSNIGYELNQTQCFIDEYNFTVTSPMNDFQDGIKLMKIAEACVNEIRSMKKLEPVNLIQKLRLPPNSFSHCTSNINLALAEFETLFGRPLLKAAGGIDSTHFLHGNTEKIYSFIWQLYLHWKLPELLDTSLLAAEIKKLKVIFQIPSKAISTPLYFDSKPIQLLLKWCKVIGYYFHKDVHNFTSSFSDGTAFCYLIHYYLPDYLESSLISIPPKDMIVPNENDENWQSNNFSPTNLAEKHQKMVNSAIKSNFKCLFDKISRFTDIPFAVYSLQNLMIKRIPDEKSTIIFLSHLFRKLIIAQREENAAIFLQRAWHQYVIRRERMRRNKAATKIQQQVRAFLFRLHEKKRIAATTVQSWYRYRWQRSEFLHTKTQIVLQQQTIRMKLQYDKLQAKQRSLRLIENWVRQSGPRRDYLHKVSSLKMIQQFIRTIQTRSHYLHDYKQVLMIQKTLKMASAKFHFDTVRSSALTLQAFERSTSERQRFIDTRKKITLLQSLSRMMTARFEFLDSRKKIIVMQNFSRLMMNRKRFLLKKKLALMLQSAFLAKQARDEMQRRIENNAAVMIQSWSKFTKQRCAFLRLRNTTKSLQHVIRGFQQRKHYLHAYNAVVQLQNFQRMNSAITHFEIAKSATHLIERFVRFSQGRAAFIDTRNKLLLLQRVVREQHARSRFQTSQQATMMIQRTSRMHTARTHFHSTRSVICTLQAYLRCIRERKEFNTKRTASLQLQAAQRMHSARSRFLSTRSKLITIQSIFRGYTSRLYFTYLRETAIQLQTVIRGVAERRRFLQTRRHLILLQSLHRSLIAQRNYQSHRAAIQMIHNFLRSSSQRQRYLSDYSKCETLQSFSRLAIGRSHFLHMRSLCSRLENFIRFEQQRRHFLHVRELLINTQSMLRMSTQRRSFLSQRRAAITLQSLLRFVRDRSSFKSTRSLLISLQCFLRSSSQRQRYLSDYRNVQTIQQTVRLSQARSYFLTTREKIVNLQSFHRSAIKRQHFKNVRSSAITVQSMFRFEQSRRDFLTQKRASLLLQRTLRAFFSRKSYLHVRSQTISVQSFLRTTQSRSKFLECRDAAKQIQRFQRYNVERGEYVEKRRSANVIVRFQRFNNARRNFKVAQRAVAMIENVLRMHEAMNELRRRQKAVVLQRWLRFEQTRKRYLKRYEEVSGAARMVQKVERMKVERTKFNEHKRRLKATKMMQKVWRGGKERRRFEEIREAVKTIQRVERMNEARKSYMSKKQSALMIQRFIKGAEQRRRIKTERNAVMTLQAMMRMMIMRRKYERMVAMKRIITFYQCVVQRRAMLRAERSAKMIQTVIRGVKERNEYKERRERMVVMMQRVVRMRIAQRQRDAIVQRRNESAIRIVKWYKQRKLIQQTRFKWFRQSFITLQRQFRYKKAIKERAVTTIQSMWRMKAVRERIDLQHRTATRIQAIWRGFNARKKITKEVMAVIQRIEEANRRATEAMKLSNRTKSALEALRSSKNLADPIAACESLDIATRLSLRCCVLIEELKGVPIILSMIQSCNRSQPHQQILKFSLNILFNMSVASNDLVVSIYHAPQLLSTVVNLMAIYNKESPEIFVRATNLLTALCLDEMNARSFAGSNYYSKVSGMFPALQKRYKVEVDNKASKMKVPLENMLKGLQKLLKRVSQFACK